MKLHIGSKLSLPLDAVTQTFAVLGKRGSGKTTAATDMAEEMLKQGQPVVIYDPTSAWYGLKSSRDGKRPGFPVVIFGGDHADVPLEETAGATIATVIVEKRIPAILDVGLLRKGARIRFMTEFCETLYHKNREAIHFFVDESHTLCPQRVSPDTARLLGAMEDIVLQGRRRGLGVTVISQRPALVAIAELERRTAAPSYPDVRPQLAALQAHIDSQPKFPTGSLQAILDWEHQSGFSTKHISIPVKPFVSRSGTTTIAAFKKQQKPQGEFDVRIGRCERAILTALAQLGGEQAKRKVALFARYSVNSGGFNNSLAKLRSSEYITGHGDSLSITECGLRAIGSYDPLPTGLALRQYWINSLGKCESAILACLCEHYPTAIDKEQLGVIAQYSHTSGGFNNALSHLRTLELITGRGDSLSAAEELFE